MACPYFGNEYCGKDETVKCPYNFNICGQRLVLNTELCGLIPFQEDFKTRLTKLPKKAKQYVYKYYE